MNRKDWTLHFSYRGSKSEVHNTYTVLFTGPKPFVVLLSMYCIVVGQLGNLQTFFGEKCMYSLQITKDAEEGVTHTKSCLFYVRRKVIMGCHVANVF